MTPDEIIEVLQGFKAGRVWEASGNAIDWGTPPDQCAENLCAHISVGTTVRLATLPDEITIPARVIPAPLREAPKVYYTIDLFEPDGVALVEWYSDEIDFDLLADGLIFATREHAIAFRKAMCPYA